MSLHKLTAGDGYTYLTRQVAAADATNRGYKDLATYYSEKGESSGLWLGSGLETLAGIRPGDEVTEAQMKSLFGEGRHPNADAITRAIELRGDEPCEGDMSSRLGNPYRIHDQPNLFRRRAAGAFRDYNTARDIPADTPVPAEARARIRSTLARQMFIETHQRQPQDARELSGHLARISRQATTAVAGYDLTFSPVKSVSTLWAIAPRHVATAIEQAHADAVKDTLAWLEQNATFTRRGKGGVAQVDVHGLITAAFTHRDSRAGDPDLHTHVAIANKVQARGDGQWLALDGRALYKNNVAASERYNTRLEALLIERLGVTFADRAGSDPLKRAVREIVGVDGDLPRLWSKRRAAIDLRRAALSSKFQIDHGRPPTPNEARELAQQANLETRQRKHEPRSHAEQRTQWRAEAQEVLGGDEGLQNYLTRSLHPKRVGPPKHVTPEQIRHIADEVLHGHVTPSGHRVGGVQNERATWQETHIRAESERRIRAAGLRVGDIDAAVEQVISRVLSPESSIALDSDDPVREPPSLRRSNGESVYTVAGSRLYTSREVVTAERSIVAAAGRHDGRTIDADLIDAAVLDSKANGVELNPGQAHLVRQLATSGSRVQLALAPAGAGKTTAMRTLAQVWTNSGGNVVGFAPSAAAAAVLGQEIQATTDTLAKLIHTLQCDVAPASWMSTIDRETLVIIDEAGMAGTADLARAIEYVLAQGGSVRLIGDDQQLAAIGAGGTLRDISEVHGAVTLSQVMRFTRPPEHPDAGAPNHAEGAASLALRDGDPASIAYYSDNGRIHVGDLATVTESAYAAWSADLSKGRDALLLAPTREIVAQLNARARSDRLAGVTVETDPYITLIDQSRASAGDPIITRRNERSIAIGSRDWVKNGDRWTVEQVRDSGSLLVRHGQTGRRITLPAGYVAEHVSLGYASTVHGAQGVTADTCHVVATGEESRQLLYVAMTRGRHSNHVHLATAPAGDDHNLVTRDALLPPTAVDILSRMIARDGAPNSATTQSGLLADPATRLGSATNRYYDAVHMAATSHLERVRGPGAIPHIDVTAEAAMAGLTHCDAYPTLRAALALRLISGGDPAELLRQVLRAEHGLDDARDPAAVLYWRLEGDARAADAASAPLPWLPAIPETLAADSEWGQYLRDRASQVSAIAEKVADSARHWTPTNTPLWARAVLAHDPELAADLAVWRAANAIPDTERLLTGPPALSIAEIRSKQSLDRRVARVRGDPSGATARWTPLATSIDPRIIDDPFWPILAERLSTGERAGIEIAAICRSVGGLAPLPDEQPAAALWWRLSEHLAPATVSASDHSSIGIERPSWAETLTDLLGPESAKQVFGDPSWPALVAAVSLATTTTENSWNPAQLLSTVHELLLSGQPEDAPLHPHELATAFAWRIRLIANSETKSSDQTREVSVIKRRMSSLLPPQTDELFTLADSTPALDDHWLASLIEPTDIKLDESDPKPRSSRIIQPRQRHTLGATSPTGLNHPALVPRERLIELNELAGQFFISHYPTSWAPTYLEARLGTNLIGDERFNAGYAPARWTALTDHLCAQGAKDSELLAAGLARMASTGRLIDHFRDRLVFPITALGESGQLEIHGWVGRRNPTQTDESKRGPKYLNTGETALFTKGHELYGLAEATPALATGAAAVIVEGPLDAIAVTLAGRGEFVGVAPLGTALTDVQADHFRRQLRHGSRSPIVATDADAAGQRAAYRAYWQLVNRGFDPNHLIQTNGKDPAELLQTSGADALYSAIAGSKKLATTLIYTWVEHLADHLVTIEGRVFTAHRAAEIIVAAPPETWSAHISQLVERIGVMHCTAVSEVVEALGRWTNDPQAIINRHTRVSPLVGPQRHALGSHPNTLRTAASSGNEPKVR